MHIKLLSASCNFRQSKVNALNNNFAASQSSESAPLYERREGVCVCVWMWTHHLFITARSFSRTQAQRKVFIKYLHRVHSARARLRAASQRKEETLPSSEGGVSFPVHILQPHHPKFKWNFYGIAYRGADIVGGRCWVAFTNRPFYMCKMP